MNKGCKYCKWYPRFTLFGRSWAQCKRVKRSPSWYGGKRLNWNPVNLLFCDNLNKNLDCNGFEEKV